MLAVFNGLASQGWDPGYVRFHGIWDRTKYNDMTQLPHFSRLVFFRLLSDGHKDIRTEIDSAYFNCNAYCTRGEIGVGVRIDMEDLNGFCCAS